MMDELEKEILRLIGVKVTWPRFRGEFKTENHVDRALDQRLSEFDLARKMQKDPDLARIIHERNQRMDETRDFVLNEFSSEERDGKLLRLIDGIGSYEELQALRRVLRHGMDLA